MSDHDFHAMRRSYEHGELREEDAGGDPIALFRQWFDDAKQKSPGAWLEANAMTLATATPGGEVSARVVLLKSLADDRFVFYTNYGSQKGRELAENPQAALVFFWPHVERQVRVTGRVERVPREQSEAYFRTRPRESQLGAAASDQSSVVASRDELQAAFDRVETQHTGGPIPMPEEWGGYALRPATIEFWQGQPGRLHDRLRYTADQDGWTVERLCP